MHSTTLQTHTPNQLQLSLHRTHLDHGVEDNLETIIQGCSGETPAQRLMRPQSLQTIVLTPKVEKSPDPGAQQGGTHSAVFPSTQLPFLKTRDSKS